MGQGFLGQIQSGRVVIGDPIEPDGEAVVTVTITYRIRDREELRALEVGDGTPVLVTVEPAPPRKTPMSREEFLAMPFFGMWKDREDMADSEAWVRKVRDQWRQPIPPQD